MITTYYLTVKYDNRPTEFITSRSLTKIINITKKVICNSKHVNFNYNSIANKHNIESLIKKRFKGNNLDYSCFMIGKNQNSRFEIIIKRDFFIESPKDNNKITGLYAYSPFVKNYKINENILTIRQETGGLLHCSLKMSTGSVHSWWCYHKGVNLQETVLKIKTEARREAKRVKG